MCQYNFDFTDEHNDLRIECDGDEYIVTGTFSFDLPEHIPVDTSLHFYEGPAFYRLVKAALRWLNGECNTVIAEDGTPFTITWTERDFVEWLADDYAGESGSGIPRRTITGRVWESENDSSDNYHPQHRHPGVGGLWCTRRIYRTRQANGCASHRRTDYWP